MKQATNEVSEDLQLFVRLPSLINFRGVFCYKNNAQGSNEKGEAIDDYYLKIKKSLDAEPVKLDPEWNDFVDDNPKLNLTKN